MSALHEWFRTSLGEAVADAECRLLSRRLTGVYARRVLQIGAFGNGQRPAVFGEARQWVMDRWAGGPVDIDADAEELPFESDSIDVVLLLHQLEVARYPHQVLREATRVVAPEGHLVLSGFNPLSLWGLRRMLAGRRGRRAPWRGRFYTRLRLEDWLALLGMAVEWRAGAMLRPPVNSPLLLRRLAGLERHAACSRWLGGVQLTMARKRVGGTIPVDPIRTPRLEVIPGGLAQPASSVAARSTSVSSSVERRR